MLLSYGEEKEGFNSNYLEEGMGKNLITSGPSEFHKQLHETTLP